MQESYQNALIETLSDIDLYGLYIFLPCILALIFTVMHKKDKRKKLWKMLLAFIPLVIVYKIIIFDFIFENTWFEVFVVFAIFYAISIIVGAFFWKKKIIIGISIPLILCASYFSYATYKFFNNTEPFGRIDEYALPSHIHSSYDYAVKITYADDWGYNLYSLTIRGKKNKDSQANDSINYCLQHGQNKNLAVKYIPKDHDKKSKLIIPPAALQKGCQWKQMTDENKAVFFDFKKQAENYQAELDCNQRHNDYEFNVDIIDYQKRRFRALELGHASVHIPMAQAIVDLGLKLISSSKDSVDMDSTHVNE